MGTVVADIAQLAVHDVGRSNNLASKGLPDTLVAKAHAENRQVAGASRISSRQMPARSGSQGPGEMITASGFCAKTSAGVVLSLRTTLQSTPKSPMNCNRLNVKLS